MIVFNIIQQAYKQILTRIETSILGSSRPPMQGIDSFQLIEKDGRWWIVSVINEIPTPDNPVPTTLSR